MTMTDFLNNEYPPHRPPWIIQGQRQDGVEALMIEMAERYPDCGDIIDRLRVLLTGGPE